MNMTPKEYNRYVARLAKKSPLGKDLLNSFLIGGLICVVGQLLLVGLGLTLVAALVAVVFVLRYEPLQILADRS